MPITGGIKFFDRSYARVDNDTSISASTGDSSASFAIDNNSFTYWRSVSSNDATTETLTITLPSSQTFDRIHLVDHNFKQYQVQYDSGGGFVDFSNVTSLDSTGGSDISETSYANSTSYYEFDEVTTDKIQITVDTTQVVNADKYLSRVLITSELGTLEGFPQVTRLFKTRNSRTNEVLSGKTLVEKSIETFRTTLDFGNYPPGLTSDLDLMYTLFDREDSFWVWPCGGRFGTDYFRYTLRGFRLQDIYLVQVNNSFNDKYQSNIYTGLVDLKVDLREAPL